MPLSRVHAECMRSKDPGALIDGPFLRPSNVQGGDVDRLAGIGIQPRFRTEYPVDALVVEPTLKTRSLEVPTVDLKIGLRHPLAGRYIR
jgi:hypothetical protein